MAFTSTFIKKKIKSAGFSSSHVTYKDFLLPITPDLLIKPIAAASDFTEKIPVLNKLAQSLFIVASK